MVLLDSVYSFLSPIKSGLIMDNHAGEPFGLDTTSKGRGVIRLTSDLLYMMGLCGQLGPTVMIGPS